jgi:carbon monoxide dehydrogenase subunit G
MKLEQSFEVQAPLQRVWEALIDVERVAPCLPGAAITGHNPDGSYNGEFKVKIGPTSAAYSGKLQMENIDEAAHSATMQAAGTDKRGQGGAKATIVSSVAETDGGATTVNVNTEYHITGRLARFGRGGMIEEISNRLLGEFAKSLQAMLAEGGTEEIPVVETADPADVVPPAEAVQSDDVLAAQSAPTEIELPAPTDTPASIDTPSPTDAPAPTGNGAAPEPVDAPEPVTNEEPVAPAPIEPPTGTAVPPSQPTISASAGASSNGGQSTPENKPVNGLSLMGKVLLTQAKRNPAPVAAAVVGFLVVARVLRRRR